MLLPDMITYLTGYTPSLGLTVQVNLFRGILRPAPDFGVWLMERGGLPDELDLGTGLIRNEWPRLQVIVRGVEEDYDTPRLLAQQIRTALAKIGSTGANSSINGVAYKAVMPLHAVEPLPQDDNLRWRFTCNFQVEKEYSTS